MPTLAEIREKLKSLDNKRSSTQFTDTLSYPFWNIPVDSTARIRFLPDGNQDNTFFWVEKQTIKIPFEGIVDGDNKPVTVTVPCVEMWDEVCPIHNEIRPWFKDPKLESLARKYWKKRNYIFQGFVLDSKLNEDDVPDNPIRRFVMSPQLFKIIKTSLLDPDFEYIPTDYVNGTDFLITKTTKGQYSDYTTSKWARRESALTQEQLDAVDEHGLFDLSEFLPKRPSAEELNAIYEMFEASVAGELYDPSRWAKYYKPFGFEYAGSTESNSTSTSSSVKTETTEPEEKTEHPKVIIKTHDDDDDVPFDVDEPKAKSPQSASSNSTSEKSAQEILDMIRNRK